MIRDEDCDLEQLTINDFEDNDHEEMRLFVIEQVKLGVLCKYDVSRAWLLLIRNHDSWLCNIITLPRAGLR